ncbi:MAG: S-methyl-5'-thioadenosine phosphorylase [Candidatus Bathyarchaeia archaeon]
MKTSIAIIGGSGLERLFEKPEQSIVKTPYGTAPPVSIGKVGGKQVVFLPRHGPNHSVPPHRINYKASIWALHTLGVRRIFATNAVGAINRDFKPGQIAVPHDFVDFTKARCTTFYDEAPVTHVDFSQPYCPQMRKLLLDAARKTGLHVWDKVVMVCTEGPRLETPAEIEMFRRLGCDIVGMTGFPEVVLARELEMCYASTCYVSNMAAGIQKGLSAHDVSRVSKQIMPKLEKLLIESIRGLPIEREEACQCASALRSARFE